MKCAFCQQRKGKRVCPLVDRREICPVCCGAHRSEACRGCSFFVQSERYQDDRRVRAGELGFPGRRPDLEAACDALLDDLVQTGDAARARAGFAELERQAPDYPVVVFGFGACAASEERHAEAAPYFERAVALHPGFAAGHFNLGISYVKLGRIEVGMRATERALLAAAPGSDIARRARERLDEFAAIVTGPRGQSVSAFLYTQSLFQRGVAALEAGDALRAHELLGQVLGREPNNARALGNLGLAHAALGHKAEALAALSRALVLDPPYELAAVNRAILEDAMEEGVPFTGIGASVDYLREYGPDKRSYIEELAADATRARTDPEQP